MYVNTWAQVCFSSLHVNNELTQHYFVTVVRPWSILQTLITTYSRNKSANYHTHSCAPTWIYASLSSLKEKSWSLFHIVYACALQMDLCWKNDSIATQELLVRYSTCDLLLELSLGLNIFYSYNIYNYRSMWQNGSL